MSSPVTVFGGTCKKDMECADLFNKQLANSGNGACCYYMKVTSLTQTDTQKTAATAAGFPTATGTYNFCAI